MSQKIVTVYGATGAQGGSVARALLRDKSGSFTIRGISRSPDSEAAKALVAEGVEIIRVNVFDKHELAAVFKGSWAAFVNTNSDDPAIGSPGLPTESQIGKWVVDAAVEAGFKYFIYSGLASASRNTSGAVPCLCFDEKEHIGKYALSQSSLRSIVVNPAYYMENFSAKEWAPYLGGLPFIQDSEDFGDIVHGVLLSPDLLCGETIQAISQSKALEEIPVDFEHATGKKARFVPVEDWRLLKTDGTRAMQTVKEMFGFCYVSGGLYYGEPNNVKLSATLKEAAAAAQGRSDEDTCLFTLGQYFKDTFT